MTSARHRGPDGDEVIHFAVPFSNEAVRVHDNWDALGMRGTGSNNVTIEDLFVSDESIVLRRPADAWHPMWNVIIPIALPLIVVRVRGPDRGGRRTGRSIRPRNPTATSRPRWEQC